MLRATVLIVSHNRKAELLEATSSAVAQNYPDTEILVLDDASTDGSLQALQTAFPFVTAIGDGKKRSACELRNIGFARATGDIVFSLDDDSYFTSPNTISEIMNEFENNPNLAVVGIPFIEPFFPSLHKPSKLASLQDISSFTGCSAAIRKAAFLRVGGYRDYFEYYGEESDLSIRLLEAGFQLSYFETSIVVHTKSRKRNAVYQNAVAIRNGYYNIILNVPLRFVAVRLLRYTIGVVVYRLSISNFGWKLTAAASGFCASLKKLNERKPVSIRTYRRARLLPAHGRTPWAEQLPPPPPCRPTA